MTKKHFVALAAILKAAKEHNEDAEYTRQYIRDQIAIMAAQDNPRFDVERFLSACE